MLSYKLLLLSLHPYCQSHILGEDHLDLAKLFRIGMRPKSKISITCPTDAQLPTCVLFKFACSYCFTIILSVCVVQYLHPAHLTTSPLDISLNVTRELWQSSALTLHCLTTCPPRFTPSRGDSDFMINSSADFWNCQDFCFSNKRSHCKKFRTDETRNDRLENQSSIVNSVFSNTGIV